MYALPPFNEFLMTYADSGPVISNLKDIYKLAIIQKNTVRPYGLLKALQENVKGIIITEQNDIHEFLLIMLETLCRECGIDNRNKMNEILQNIQYQDTSFDRQKQKMDLDWANKVSKEYSILQPMFFGQHICQIICNHCQKIWHNYELYQNIFLSLGKDTLDECLRDHFEDVKLTEWKCDVCGHGTDSAQTTLLWRNPQILIITLKRFEFDPRAVTFVKNAKSISIPERLDISTYTIGKSRSHYTLKAVAFHNGSYHGGHYHAICKGDNGEWILHDDENVQTLGQTSPYLGSGYVFFYVVT